MNFELLFDAIIGDVSITYLYSANRGFGYRLAIGGASGNDVSLFVIDEFIEMLADDLEDFDIDTDSVSEIESNTFHDLDAWLTYPDGIYYKWSAIRETVFNAVTD